MSIADRKIRTSQAYKMIFNTRGMSMWAWLGKIPFVKKLAYRKVFDPQGVYSAIVLDDLRRICGGTGSLWRGDTNETLRMTARNEVFCHIRANINITDADISKLYADTLENLND